MQPIVEVREKKGVLVGGIVATVLFGAACFLSCALMVIAGDYAMAIGMGLFWGIFLCFGLYLLGTYMFHKLQIFSEQRIVFRSWYGRKTEFTVTDIAKVAGHGRKGTFSLYLADSQGKKLAKVESNMADYPKLLEWLDMTRRKMIENEKTPFVVEPFKVYGTGKVARVFLAIMGLVLIFAGVMAAKEAIEDSRTSTDDCYAMLSFDPYTASDMKQVVSFEMISYAFASFELSDAQGLYFVFDENMYPYIVCMENERLETEFAEIYEYTFSDALEAPGTGELEGYAIEIEDELKQIAIEEFNYLWNEEIINDENFSDYFGNYYLDSTYIPPTEGESLVTSLLLAVFFIIMGIYVCYYCFIGYKKHVKEGEKPIKSSLAEAALGGGITSGADDASNADTSSDLLTAYGESVQEGDVELPTVTPVAGELPVPRNILLSILATIIGAALGGIVWIFFYKLGRIVAIAGYIAVFGAIFGWTKFGRRELTKRSTIWCMFVGALMIVLANCLSYAWEILDALNATSQNRAEFSKILMNFPRLMSEWELWGSFVGELAIGLVLALAAGLGSLFGKKK